MSLIISDSEPSDIPNRSVTARPSSLPLVINGVPDTSRLHKASFGDNLRWYLELPWPSETEPSDVQWVIIRSDGTEYAGHVPEGIPGPLTLDDLLVHHGWSNVVPPGPLKTNLLPPEVFIFQGPVAPIQDMNPPKVTAVGEHSLIISDSEPSGLPGGRSVTARPSSLPLSINGVPDIARFHVASFADNLRWYLALPWPSETDPGDIQWIVIRSDGTEYAGHIPEGIRGPLTLDDLVVNYGWGVVVPPPLGPIEDNLLPTVGGDVSVIQGPTGPAPVYDLYANRPSASAAGDRTLFVATDLGGGTLFEVQTLLGVPTWVQIGIGALDARLSDSRVPTLHAPTHGILGSDPVALDAGQITSGVLALARLSGLSHSQLDASAGILGTQIHDVPTTLLTGLLGAAQGGLGLDASGALARELLLGTGSGAFTLGFLIPGDIPSLDASKIVSGTIALSRLSGITGAQLSGTAGITSGQIASVAASTLTGVISSAQFSLVPGDIPGLDAAKITSGTMALAHLSGITTNELSPAAGIVSSQIASVLASTLQGTINSFNLSLVPGDIPGLDASKITSGTLALSRLSGITGAQLSGTAGITSGQIASVSTSTLVGVIGSSHLSLVPGDIPNLDASKITTGVFTTGLIPNLNAAKITSGTLALARGGTGLDSSGATNGQLLIGTGSGLSLATLTAGDNITITNSSGGITIASIISSAVTSVGLAAPSEFSVSGSPVTGTGTLTFTKLNQNANLVYAGPTTGASGAPTFRYLVAADIPTLPASRITGGQLATARGGTGLDTSSAANGQLLIGTGTGLALATLVAGTGITITNTSGHIQIDGATTYTLPIASASVLGGIKVGANLAIDGTGVLSGTYSYSLPVASTSVLGGVKQGANVTIDGTGVLSVAAPYSLPVATTSVLGGVKQGSNVTIDISGVLSVAAPYSLPTASASVLGGIKVGSGLNIDGSGILSATGVGSGTVTSVDITAPSEITVAGSPVTSSGTIALTWASETQHFVFAGPSGSSGTPGFRALLASDIPALGYVTSVALTVPADFTISGSPITSSGTLGLTWNAQTGNVVMASPSGGGSGTPTFRSLVSDDIPNLDVAKITTGTFATSFIPNLDAAKITTGTLSSSLLPIATSLALGAIKVGTTLSIASGVLDYNLPTASASVLGGIKVGSGLSIALGVVSTVNNGTVTSVSLTAPSEISVAGSPITGSGTLALTWANETGNVVFSSPSGGGSGTPTFRSLVTADLPNLDASKITTGTLALARGGTNADNSSQLQNLVWASPDGSTGAVTYRSLVASDIPNLDTSKITTGTLSLSRLSGITTTQLSATAGIVAAQIASVNPSVLTGSGTVPLAGLSGITTTQLSATAGITSGQITSIPNQNASIITTGTLALTRGGTNADNSSQLQNLVWASPDGSTGAVTYRALVAADIPNLNASKITAGTLSSARLPTADASNLGAIKVGTTLSIASGVLDYNLPTASASVLGGIKVGTGLSISSGVLSTTTSGGTVTSVALTAPSEISVTGSPITGSGTLALTWVNQTGNTVFSSPSGGSSGTPGFRSLVAADLPADVAYTDVANVFTQNQTIDGRVIVDIGSSSVEAITVQGTPSNNVRIAFYNNTVGNSKTQFTFGGTLDAHRWAFGNDSSGNNTQNFFLYDAAANDVRLFIDNSGNLVIGAGLGPVPSASATLDVRTSSSSTIGAIIRGASGQSVNLQEWQTSTSTAVASISTSGNLTLVGTKNILSSLPDNVTSYGLLNLGSEPFDGVTSGFFSGAIKTVLAMNVPSASFFGSLIDCQLSGSSKFTVNYAGSITKVSNITMGGTASAYTLSMQLSAPPGTPSGSIAAGGSLVSGTSYYYRVSALDVLGGETTANTQSAAITPSGGNLTVALSWTGVHDAAGYIVYRTTVSGDYSSAVAYTVIGATSFNDTGASGSSAVPSANNLAHSTDINTTTSSTNYLSEKAASAEYGTLSIGGSPFTSGLSNHFTGSGNGTEVAINAASGYTGNFIDAQLAGVSKFSVSYTGIVATRGISVPDDLLAMQWMGVA